MKSEGKGLWFEDDFWLTVIIRKSLNWLKMNAFRSVTITPDPISMKMVFSFCANTYLILCLTKSNFIYTYGLIPCEYVEKGAVIVEHLCVFRWSIASEKRYLFSPVQAKGLWTKVWRKAEGLHWWLQHTGYRHTEESRFKK